MSEIKQTTKTCGKCKMDIPGGATKCPYCRSEQTSPGQIAAGCVVMIIVMLFLWSCSKSCVDSAFPSSSDSPSVSTVSTHYRSSTAPAQTAAEIISDPNEPEDDDYAVEEITGAFGFYFGAKIDRGRASRQQLSSDANTYIYRVGAPRENYRNFSDCRIMTTADGTIYGIVAFKKFATERERKDEINAIRAELENGFGVKPRRAFEGEFYAYKMGDTWVDIDVYLDKAGGYVGLQFTQEDKYVYPK